MYFCIDLGGTFIKYGIVENKEIKYKNKFPLNNLKLQEVLENVSKILQNEIEKNKNLYSKLIGISISFPGIVDSINNKILSTNNKYSDAKEFDFAKWGKETFGVEVKLENDAKMALLGEVYNGVAKNKQNVSLIIFGTGLGTAVFNNGKILKSKNFIAGNLGGHFASVYFGRQCTCGNIGCTEAYSSNWAIDSYVRGKWDIKNSLLGKYEKIDYKAVIDESHNCKIAKEVFEDLMAHWKTLLVNMIHAYDSEIIVLSGGLINSKEYILKPLEDHIKKYAWLPDGAKVEIVCAEEPDYSVMIGGEALFEMK
ncbi:MAG: ROK family protein [Fusobacteriaceae bacterium]